MADATDPNTDGIRQIFTNKDLEGRVEVQLMPFNLRFAELTTAIGIQSGHQKLDAPSPDDVGSPINGLFDLNKNSRVAGYIFNEFKFSDTTKAQIAGRIERVNLSGMTPSVIPDTFADTSAIGAATPHSLTFTPKSERGPDPGSAVGSRRQRDRAICRAGAETCGAVSRGGRRNGDLRHRQSESRPKSQNRSKSVCAAPKDRSGSRRPVLHQVRRFHLPARPATPATAKRRASPRATPPALS